MWWIKYKNILDYIEFDKDSIEKKEALIFRKEKYIKHIVSNLSNEELLHYLFDSKIHSKIKKYVSDKIELIYSDKKQTIRKDNINSLLKTRILKNGDLLNKDIPNCLKETISQILYPESLINIVLNENIHFSLKKELILAKFVDEDLLTLLKNNLDDNLLKFILTSFDISSRTIFTILKSSNYTDDIKNKLINYSVTSKNIIDLFNETFLPDIWKEKLQKEKGNLINEYINSIKEDNILDELHQYKYEEDFIKLIYTKRIDLVNKAISSLTKNNVWEVIYEARYPELLDNISKQKAIEIIDGVSTIKDYRLFYLLNRNNIPNNLKNEVVKQRRNDIYKNIKELSNHDILNYSNADSPVPSEIKDKIVELRKEDILKYVSSFNESDVIYKFIYGSAHEEIEKMIIDKVINKDNIINLLVKCEYHPEKGYKIIKQKKDVLIEILDDISSKELFNLKPLPLRKNLKNLIISECSDYLEERLKDLNYSPKELYILLNSYDSLENIKLVLLKSYGICENNTKYALDLMNYADPEIVINNFDLIKEFILKCGIDFNSFMQYGIGSKKYKHWIESIITICNDKKEKDFYNALIYFKSNYYSNDYDKENGVYIIRNFLELLNNYSKYSCVLDGLVKEQRPLTNKEKEDINFLFNYNGKLEVNNITELLMVRQNVYKEYLTKIKDENTTLDELKEIFNTLLFSKANVTLEIIGGTKSLKGLIKENSDSKTITNLSKELIKYASIIEMVNDSNNVEGLRKILLLIFGEEEKDLIEIQNLFSLFDEKVRKLYELDSQINLTMLSKYQNIDSIFDDSLSSKYGGVVYNLSDKNYVLYAHALSHRETMDMIMNGESSATSNFISVSPISYYGQKYYYDISKLIVAYDKIPNGSFVCSSKNNMGSNGNITNNSSEVVNISRNQRGILETSSAVANNSEALLYREGLIPVGLILPGNREPSKEEMEAHKNYNLPFIITQEIGKPIENPKKVFGINTEYYEETTVNKRLDKIIDILEEKVIINKETNIYTGREIALFTDSHSLYEPTIAVLESIRRRGITEIYSLGDNVGVGPDPDYVFDLLEDYKVKSVCGNSEYYNLLGTKPFPYLDNIRIESQEWTKDKLGSKRIEKMSLWTPSIDLIIGDKKISLCHFANDIRWDYVNSTWTYQANFEPGVSSRQFLYTNSDGYKKKLNDSITSNRKKLEMIRGMLSSKNSPLFEGKLVTEYDAIFQGHVHYDFKDFINQTDIYTLRACGMGFKDDDENTACYYILKERKDGNFDIERKLVKYNKNQLISNINSSSLPNKEKILSMIKK